MNSVLRSLKRACRFLLSKSMHSGLSCSLRVTGNSGFTRAELVQQIKWIERFIVSSFSVPLHLRRSSMPAVQSQSKLSLSAPSSMPRNWTSAISMSIVALFAVLMLALPLNAQQSGSVTGGLSGTVIDSSSAVVAGATVTVTGPQGSHVTTTDTLGHYSFSGLIPGSYDIKVEKTGFKAVKAAHNEVVVGSASLLNVTLPVGNTT